MEQHILVAYATRAGSTREVAEVIGEVLRASGAVVDVRMVKEVKDLSAYTAVVLGSATRMGKLLPEAVSFANKYHAEFVRRPTAYFAVGITMKQYTPERRQQAEVTLEPLCKIKSPVSKGLFAGKVDRTKLEFVWRVMLSSVKDGDMADGDFRDWDAIRRWAGQVAVTFQPMH